MQYNVYADLSRQLTEQERSTIFEALDTTVPDSGCVGLQGGPTDEVFFRVAASSQDSARSLAKGYMDAILKTAALDITYSLALQK